MKCFTDSAIELTWPGVPVTACASMRPLRSNTPAERSPHSRTIGREGGAQQRLRLLLDHRDQPVPHDLQVDEARVGFGHCACIMPPSAPCTMHAGAIDTRSQSSR